MRRLVWRYATHIVGVSAAALRGGLGHKTPGPALPDHLQRR
jgi:hypothetical protein